MKNGFNLANYKFKRDEISVTRYYCKLSQAYRYSLRDGDDFWGELRQSPFGKGEWNWFLRGTIKVMARGEGTLNECLEQIKNVND